MSEGFWKSTIGMVTAIAGAITAIIGLIIAFNKLPDSGNATGDKEKTETTIQQSEPDHTTDHQVKDTVQVPLKYFADYEIKSIKFNNIWGGKVTINISGATIEEDGMNFILNVAMKVDNNSNGGFGEIAKDLYRLHIDGLSTAPYEDSDAGSGGSVSSHSAKIDTIRFHVPANAKLEGLSVIYMGELKGSFSISITH